jgi:hypothetical protein
MKLATAYYELVPSMGGNQGAITQEFTGVGAKASKGFGKSFAGGLKSAVGPAVALLGAASIGSFLKDSVGEARDAQKVGALTEQRHQVHRWRSEDQRQAGRRPVGVDQQQDRHR